MSDELLERHIDFFVSIFSIFPLLFFLWNWAVNSGKYASYAFHMPFRGDEEASDFMKRIIPNSIMPFGII